MFMFIDKLKVKFALWLISVANKINNSIDIDTYKDLLEKKKNDNELRRHRIKFKRRELGWDNEKST